MAVLFAKILHYLYFLKGIKIQEQARLAVANLIQQPSFDYWLNSIQFDLRVETPHIKREVE
jgi:hypothetical protein